jgi:hypothetical protein
MVKYTFKQWKWFDRNWNEKEPESILDSTKPLKINILLKWKEYFQKEAEHFWDEIDNHNLKKEQEESKENAENLRNLTKDFLKTNNLV